MERGSPPGPLDATGHPAVRVLGSLALRGSGREVSFERSTRARRVLAALLINRGELVTADRLADVAWGSAPPLDPRAATHNLISRLRALIGDVPEIELLTRPSGYLLNAPRHAVDACLFEDRVRAAPAASDPQESLERVEAALALWRGPAYAEFADEEFARAEAGRLTVLRQAAEETRIDAMLALGLNDQAISRLERLIADDPLRERPRLQLMTALYRVGRVADALASYRTFRELMHDELGLEPGAALSELEGRILRREVTLQLSTRCTPPAEEPRPVPAAGRPRTSFVGRDADLTAIADLLADRRLVTLVGSGGVGKTRLATHVSRLLADRYPDGVIVCELSALSDGAQIADLIASQSGITPDGAAPADRRSLLVLDNCEHVVDSVVEVVELLLGASAVRILATSREPLGVPEEQVWWVEPLYVPAGEDFDAPSVRLFVERARSVEPSFAPTANLVELCRRLDGLPLAIELAAARMNSMTVEEILCRLDEQPNIVDGGRRARQPRHRSLNAVVDWSYHLLGDDQKTVFDQLAVFPDDFSLDAATAVVDTRLTPDDVVATILGLVDRSLVTHIKQAGTGRYRLLGTLRAYGRRHLRDQGTFDGLRARHAAWYLGQAEELGHALGAGRPDWIGRLDQELANFRAAHEWLVARTDLSGMLRLTASLHFFALWSLNPEVFDWARAAIALADRDTADPRLATAYATVAHGCWLTGDLTQSREYADLAIAVAGDDPIGWYGRVALANALASAAGERERRADLYRNAAALAERAGARPHQVHALILYGTCLMSMGKVDEAERVIRRMLREACRLGTLDLEAKARLCVADLSIADDPANALRGYWEAADLNARIGNRYGEFQALVSAAFAEIQYGDAECAIAVFSSLLGRWTGLLRDTALFCLLQGVVILLAEADGYRDAATLRGAIPVDAPMIAFTVDENVTRRMATAAERLADVLGPAELAELGEAGRAMPREDAYALATTALRSIG